LEKRESIGERERERERDRERERERGWKKLRYPECFRKEHILG